MPRRLTQRATGWALPVVARAVFEKDPVVRKLVIDKRVMRMIKRQNEVELQRKTSIAQKVGDAKPQCCATTVALEFVGKQST